MNLLPRERGRRRSRLRGPGIPARMVSLAGSLFVGGSLLGAFLEVRSLDARLLESVAERDRLGQLIAEREGAEERLRSGREQLRELRAAARRLARWDEERFLLPELLRGLSLGVNDAVVLEELRREGSRIRITGRAESAEAVAEAVRGLSRLDRLEGLELLWVEQQEEGVGRTGQRFSLACGLRYNSREPDPFEVVAPVEGAGQF